MDVLNNNRFLHMKNTLARTVESKTNEVATHIEIKHIPGWRSARTQYRQTPPDNQNSHGKN